MQRELPLGTVQALLGRSTSELTREVYLRAAEQRLGAAVCIPFAIRNSRSAERLDSDRHSK